jgi:hypothetical protein
MRDQPGRRVRDVVEPPPVQPQIRKLVEDDLPALLAFGTALPKDDWLYLDIDLHTEATIVRLINAVEARNWRQFVAVVGDEIVGYASVRQLPAGSGTSATLPWWCGPTTAAEGSARP